MQHQKLAQSYLNRKHPTQTRTLNPNLQTLSTDYPSDNQNEGYFSREQVSDPNEGILSLEQQRLIQDILGYPVTEVIFDQKGDIILNIGDLITYQAVERAIKANVFETLLNAVYMSK